MNRSEPMSDERKVVESIADELRPDYLSVRILPDGSIAALGDLLYTRAIYLGVNRISWERRFCFEDRALASRRFAELKSEEDVPEGYTARRGL